MRQIQKNEKHPNEFHSKVSLIWQIITQILTKFHHPPSENTNFREDYAITKKSYFMTL